MYIFIILVIAWIIIVFVYNLHKSQKQEQSEKEIAYYELNQKQYIRGTESKSITTAKDALNQLVHGYEEIKSTLSAASASCYEDDILVVRSHIEDIAEEIWHKKANTIFTEFIRLYLLVTAHNFGNIEKAYNSKDKCLAQYDAYWEWTRKMHEEYSDCFDTLNLWECAKEYFRNRFSDETGENECNALFIEKEASISTRALLEKHLNNCIVAIQPEYRRKMQLRDIIIADIRKNGTIQRSKLLKTSYDGFIESEVRACYRTLINEHILLEYKQGNLYFVTVSEQ